VNGRQSLPLFSPLLQNKLFFKCLNFFLLKNQYSHNHRLKNNRFTSVARSHRIIAASIHQNLKNRPIPITQRLNKRLPTAYLIFQLPPISRNSLTHTLNLTASDMELDEVLVCKVFLEQISNGSGHIPFIVRLNDFFNKLREQRNRNTMKSQIQQ